jgi:hypothetical protein
VRSAATQSLKIHYLIENRDGYSRVNSILFSTSFKKSIKRKCIDIDVLLVFYQFSFDTFLLSRINESKGYGSDEYTHFKNNHIK